MSWVKNIFNGKKSVLWVSIVAMVVVTTFGVLLLGKATDNGPGSKPSPSLQDASSTPERAAGDTQQAWEAAQGESIKMTLRYDQSMSYEGSIRDPLQIKELMEMFESLNYEDSSLSMEYPQIEIRFQSSAGEQFWAVDKNQLISGSAAGAGNKLLQGTENIYERLRDTLNRVLAQSPAAEQARLSLYLDGQMLASSDRFYIKQSAYHYFNVLELSELLGFKTLCTTDQPIEKNGVSIPAHTIAVFFEGYVTMLTLGDTCAVTTKIGSSEASYYPMTQAPAVFDQAYYVEAHSLPFLFFVRLNTPLPEDDGFLKDAELSSLAAQIEKTQAYIEGKGYVYQASGNPFYDRHILTAEVIARTKKGDADSVFWMDSDTMEMGPIMSHLTYTDFGYIRSMNDQKGNTYYGLYAQPFGHETLPLKYTEIKCIDYRSRFLSLATGFGANRRYGGAHIAPGFSELTLIPVSSPTPLTVKYMRDYVLSQGIPIDGEWSSALYTSAIHSSDFVSEEHSRKQGASIWLSHPIRWSFPYHSAIDSDMSLYDGINPIELKLRPGKTWIISAGDFLKFETEFYPILYPREQDRILSSEAYELEGRQIYRYKLSPSKEDGKTLYYPVHYFIYFDEGALCDITLYGLSDNDKYEQASFRRIIESIAWGGLWSH